MMEDEARWYGVFQSYRPYGEGVEDLFVGLRDAFEYSARIQSICQASYHDNWATDGYFVVRTPPPSTDEKLIHLGGELLSSLRMMAILATLSGQRELHDYLAGVNQVTLVSLHECDRRHDDHQMVHGWIGEILRGFYDFEHRVIQLREGFYSVACDYWLAWYLQWPFFNEWIPKDVFRPYYELWARGCEVAFQDQRLCLARKG